MVLTGQLMKARRSPPCSRPTNLYPGCLTRERLKPHGANTPKNFASESEGAAAAGAAGLDGDAEVDAFELVRRASAGTAGFELAAERTERAEGEARDATERAEPGALMPLARAPVDREEGIAGGGDAFFGSALMTLPSKAA